ncbi:MAG TPA: hypothetical protein VKP65_24790 [Rhodothermales bacterium]|nr:hypothetical protein [Rhodothermales bacterium]
MDFAEDLQVRSTTSLRRTLSHVLYLCETLQKYKGPVRLKQQMEAYKNRILEELETRRSLVE